VGLGLVKPFRRCSLVSRFSVYDGTSDNPPKNEFIVPFDFCGESLGLINKGTLPSLGRAAFSKLPTGFFFSSYLLTSFVFRGFCLGPGDVASILFPILSSAAFLG